MFLFITKFIGMLVLVFAAGEIIGHIFRLDKYLKYGSDKSPEQKFRS
jgi:hypothetical protein